MREATDGRRRHRWLKLRLHVYICKQCGCGRVNAQTARGEWFTTFHLPTGRSVRPAHTPACEPGPFTARYLAKYRRELEAAAGVEWELDPSPALAPTAD